MEMDKVYFFLHVSLLSDFRLNAPVRGHVTQSQFSTCLSQALTVSIVKPILQIQTLAASNAIAHSPLRLQCLAAAAAVPSSLRSYRRFRHGGEKRNILILINISKSCEKSDGKMAIYN
nr:hypothetical protein CFP56_29461 [Quercus suber]